MFIENLKVEQYNELAKATNNEHFLHSVRWAEFRENNGWDYKIVGLEKEGELVMAAVIMLKNAGKVPFKVAYTSRGYIYKTKEYEKEFTDCLKKYLKKQKAFVYKIDPNELYATLDKKLERIGQVNDQRVEELKNLGYEHLGFVNNFEGMQPRHTIRIDTTCTYEEALKRMDAKTRNRTKSGIKNGLVVERVTEKELPIFMEIFKDTAERDNFTIRDISYFENMFKIFKDDLNLYLAKVDFKKAIEILEEDKKEVNENLAKIQKELAEGNLGAKFKKKINNKIKEYERKIEKDDKLLAEFTEEMEKYPDGKYIGGSLNICDGKRSWYIYGATSSEHRYMLPSYALVATMVNDLIDQEFEYFDMFGIGGDFDPENHVFGLYDFKKGFGGQPIEFIGEFDLPINKPIYFAFSKLYPQVKNLRKKLGK